MNALTREEQFDVLGQLVRSYSEAVKNSRICRICFSAIAGKSDFVTDEKIRAVIKHLVLSAGSFEKAFSALRSLPCFTPSDLDTLRKWVREKKGGVL